MACVAVIHGLPAELTLTLTEPICVGRFKDLLLDNAGDFLKPAIRFHVVVGEIDGGTVLSNSEATVPVPADGSNAHFFVKRIDGACSVRSLSTFCGGGWCTALSTTYQTLPLFAHSPSLAVGGSSSMASTGVITSLAELNEVVRQAREEARERESRLLEVLEQFRERESRMQEQMQERESRMQEQIQKVQSEQREQARQVLRLMALRIAPAPVSPPLSSPTRSTDGSSRAGATPEQRAAQRSQDAEQLERKKKAIEFYGLGGPFLDDDKGSWRARTMLMLDGEADVPFQQARLAHIYPRSTPDDVVDDLVASLHITDPYWLNNPRSFLVLPPIVELAFDREAILLLPGADGAIAVCPWRLDTLTRDELATLRPYIDKQLDWPTRQVAQPCLPFMRLLGVKMVSAMRRKPTDGAYDDELRAVQTQRLVGARAAAMEASPSKEGNEGLKQFAEGLGLGGSA
jgi:TolA-binding protein